MRIGNWDLIPGSGLSWELRRNGESIAPDIHRDDVPAIAVACSVDTAIRDLATRLDRTLGDLTRALEAK